MIAALNYRFKSRFSYRLLVSIVLALVVAQYARSQEPQGNENSQNNSRIDDIIEKSIQAYGNQEHLADFADSAQFIGSISSPDDNWQKHAYKFIRKSPAWRTDTGEEGTDTSAAPNATTATASVASTIFDGTNLWQVGASATDNTARVKTLSPEKSQWLADQADRQPFLLAYWRNPAYHFQLLGETNYKHVPVYAIEITYKNHTPTLLYLDRNNYLVCALTFQSLQPVANSDELKKGNSS